MKLNKMHIIIIVIGAIFMLLGAFHSNIWFDESYTVGMIHQDFEGMIIAGIDDVHPLLYYILLKLYSIIAGTSIISMRVFSCLGIILLSILGFTHIRKDLGEKTGLLFSVLVNILPITYIYANEIRMYSWAALFVTLSAIYGYRAYKENTKKNWILFAISSILAAYTHYYALMAISVINIVLMVVAIKNRQKYIKKWIMAALLEIVLFIPGLIVFIKQAIKTAGGFWISVKYPDVLKDILTFNYSGILDSNILNFVIFIFSSFIGIYLITRIIKLYKENKEETKLPIWGLIVYVLVICIALLISIAKPMFITRYTFPMIGLYTIRIKLYYFKGKKQIYKNRNYNNYCYFMCCKYRSIL